MGCWVVIGGCSGSVGHAPADGGAGGRDAPGDAPALVDAARDGGADAAPPGDAPGLADAAPDGRADAAPDAAPADGPLEGGAATDASPDAPCVESWSCTAWTVAGGQATRTCTDGSGCGTTAQKPPVGPLALPALDLNYYKCRVQPILDRNCSMMACHGTDTGHLFRTYARGRWRNDEIVCQPNSCLGNNCAVTVNLQREGSGTIMCSGWTTHTATEWQKNFDSARLFRLAVPNTDEVELLARPTTGTAYPHLKFFAKDDASYTTLKSWLDGATLATCDPTPN
jgi:hypothetical protein